MARQFDNREKMADLFFAISYYRRRRGMSQEQLAEELGISVSAVNKHIVKGLRTLREKLKGK